MADKPLIAIDIDNVIAELNDAVRMWTNKKAGSQLEMHHFERNKGEYWGYYERVWAEHGIGGLDMDIFIDDMAIDEVEVPLLAGAAFAIEELLKKYRIVLVTARHARLRNHTEKWVKEHVGEGIEVYGAGNAPEGDTRTKGQVLKELGAIVLVDDNVAHCQSVLDEGLGAVLFGEYGWQQDIPEQLVHCKDWPAVLEYLNGLR